jgi:hypothetical protein
MKHNFEEHRQNRIDYANDQAEKNAKRSEALSEKANEMARVIPFGQPILIGHHSENGDRNYRDKIHNTFGKSVVLGKIADYYEVKAKTIENNNAIFSDDPEAVKKLKEKLQSLETLQEFMKAANKCIKKMDKEAFLKIPHATEKTWEGLITPSYNGLGFPAYRLQNNNAMISTTKKRIAQMEKQSTLTTKEETIRGVRLIENVEANRVQLFFDDKPSDAIRENLKSNGFRWCHSEGSWQRHLNPWAVRIAHDILNRL